MASVGLSGNRKYRIRNRASSMFHTEVTQANAARPVHLDEKAREECFPSWILTRARDLPFGMVSFTAYQNYTIEYRIWREGAEDYSYSYETRTFSGSVPSCEVYPTITFKDHYEICVEYSEWKQRVYDIEHKRDKYLAHLGKVMGECTTLNQLIKVFPGAKHLAEQDDLDKIAQKVQRKKREIVVEEESIAQLNQEVTKNILINSLDN